MENQNSAHSFTEGSDSGTLKFSNTVSTEKEETRHNTLNDIKDRIAKEEGFKNWTELTWEVNYTSYELLWGKVANELVKENQELKALCREVLTAREQYQFFVNGYANGSASISEANHAATVEHEAYSKLWDFLKSSSI